MPGPHDHDERDAAEQSFGAFLRAPGHDKPKDHSHVRPNDPVTKAHVEADDIEPDWHKHGRTAPPGWKAVGDTFVEE